MSVSVIICAAGKGLRAGFNKNKLFIPIDGEPVLQKTIRAFCFDEIDEILITYSPTDITEIQSLTQPFTKVKLVQGGSTRTQSVYNALQSAMGKIVLIHDGARPFVSREIIQNCIQSVQTYGSGICAVPCTDTVSVCNGQGEIIDTPDRDRLYNVQTPQGFYLKDILSAYSKAFSAKTQTFTDDASVYAAYFDFPRLCKGDYANVKLTTKQDFEKHSARVGFGVDTHAFGKEQDYILLAGVKIPSHSGLIAHSDGDVLIHAVMDAMLSAAGLKDIGHYFPDTDEKWKNASSMQMLLQVKDLLSKQGFAVNNLSVAIHAEKPRLAKYIDEIKNNLAYALDCNLSHIGVGAGTNEGLGYVGEGKGITVYAYVLLKGI